MVQLNVNNIFKILCFVKSITENTKSYTVSTSDATRHDTCLVLMGLSHCAAPHPLLTLNGFECILLSFVISHGTNVDTV